MVGIIASQSSQALQAQSISAQSSSSQTRLQTDRSIADKLSLSSDAQDSLSSQGRALNALSQNDSILRTQRISFLQQQLAELNNQIDTLRGFLETANADQAQTLGSGIRDVGGQIERVGGDIRGLIETSSRSVSVEAIEGSFSQSFNAASIGQGSSGFYTQELQGDFSFYRINVEEQNTSIAFDAEGNLSIEQTTTQSELIVSELNIQSSETFVGIEGDSPLDDLINTYDATSNNFNALVNDALEALEVNDGGVNELLEFLDDLIEQNRINFFA